MDSFTQLKYGILSNFRGHMKDNRPGALLGTKVKTVLNSYQVIKNWWINEAPSTPLGQMCKLLRIS